MPTVKSKTQTKRNTSRKTSGELLLDKAQVQRRTEKFLTISAFDLGLPLYMHSANDWNDTKIGIEANFNSSKKFQVFSNYAGLLKAKETQEDNGEANLPLESWILLQYNNFDKEFPLSSFLTEDDEKYPAKDIGHKIFVLPTGIVLIETEIIFQEKIREKDLELDNNYFSPIEDHIDELEKVFLRVRDVILDSLTESIKSTPQFLPVSENLADNYYLDTYYLFLKKIDSENQKSTNTAVFRYAYADVSFLSQDDDIEETFKLYPGCNEALIVDIARVGYSIFVSLLLFQRLLDRCLYSLSNSTKCKKSSAAKDLIEDIRMKRLYYLYFKSQTQPMSISLDKQFIEAIQKFLDVSGSEKLSAHIDVQLGAIEDYLEWHDGRERGRFNCKVSRIALWISVLSLTAVAAQVIGTVDFQLNWDQFSRSIIIGLSFALGCGIALFYVHDFFWGE